MIRVHFAPHGDGKSKYVYGKVEVDGVDISHMVTAVQFTRDARGANVLRLDVVIGKGDDEVELILPDEALEVRATVIKNGEAIDVTGIDAAAAKRLLVA